MELDLNRAQKILLDTAKYLATTKLRFIVDSDNAVTTEDFVSEIFTAGYHATCHAYYEEKYEPKHAVNYGKLAMRNFTINIIKKHTTNKRNLYITEENENGEVIYTKKNVSLCKIENILQTENRELEEFVIQKELLELIIKGLQELDSEQTYEKIFKQFMDNDMMSLRRIAADNGSSLFKMREAIKKILRTNGICLV